MSNDEETAALVVLLIITLLELERKNYNCCITIREIMNE